MNLYSVAVWFHTKDNSITYGMQMVHLCGHLHSIPRLHCAFTNSATHPPFSILHVFCNINIETCRPSVTIVIYFIAAMVFMTHQGQIATLFHLICGFLVGLI